MEFMTYHDFMFWTKGMAYVGMGLALVGFIVFWNFLSSREDDRFADKEEE
jgi:plastocyanin domain-containing protein